MALRMSGSFLIAAAFPTVFLNALAEPGFLPR